MDKNIDLIINLRFIGSQQTHGKKSYMICLQRIYNFLLFHVVILSTLGSFIIILYHFLVLTY